MSDFISSPYRCVYVHEECGVVNYMSQRTAKLFHEDPSSFSTLRCSGCQDNFPTNEFFWNGSEETLGA